MGTQRTGRRRNPRMAWPGVLLLLFLAYQGYLSRETATPVTAAGVYRVSRVVDGDTLLLVGGSRVRLLGVDTPETKAPNRPIQRWGPEASEFTRGHVEGRDVRLQFDRERRDQYGRLLAYVYLDDWFLNEELILAGFSRAQLQYPYSSAMKRRFREAEVHAKKQRLGIWSDLPEPVAIPPRGRAGD